MKIELFNENGFKSTVDVEFGNLNNHNEFYNFTPESVYNRGKNRVDNDSKVSVNTVVNQTFLTDYFQNNKFNLTRYIANKYNDRTIYKKFEDGVYKISLTINLYPNNTNEVMVFHKSKMYVRACSNLLIAGKIEKNVYKFYHFEGEESGPILYNKEIKEIKEFEESERNRIMDEEQTFRNKIINGENIERNRLIKDEEEMRMFEKELNELYQDSN